MNLLIKIFFGATVALATTGLMSGCHDKVSYADLLSEETHAVNYYLANHRVVNDIPADSVFETGPDAPYYRLDEDGNLYMQVLYAGDRKNNAASHNELIYFRYTRYDLKSFMNFDSWTGTGNSLDMWSSPTSFRYGNTSLSSSVQYGSGIQVPLSYLGIDCEVNLVVKSQYGFYSEIAQVIPYMYNLRYFKSPL